MHRVYMHFMLCRGGWYVQFLEPDLKTPLPRTLNFADPDNVREMYHRFSASRDSEALCVLDYALEQGRGSLWLSLTAEQYRKLGGKG